MKVLANASLGKHAKAIPGDDAFSCRPLIRPLIRSSAIWLNTIVVSPNDEARARAALAVAHRILVILYHLVTTQTTDQEKGETVFEERDRPGREKRLVRHRSRLGSHVALQPLAQPG